MERCIREAHERYAEEIPEGQELPEDGDFEIREIDPENNDGDKIVFYNRVHGNVVSALVQNMMTTTAWDELTLHKEKFSFKDLATGEWSIDGPCLVKTLLMKIDPDTMVGLESLRKKLETARLHHFKNNVPEMLNFMETTYKEIRNNGKTHDSYLRHLLDALLSGSNATFTAFIQRIKDDIDGGFGTSKSMTADQLIVTACQKYVNMVEQKEWDKVDPRDAQILALTTMVQEMREQHSVNAVSGDRQKQNGNNTSETQASNESVDANDKVDGLPRWRITHTGPTKRVDNFTWHWCHHHVKEGKWNGMYVRHPETKHDEWVEKYKNRKEKKAVNVTENNNDGSKSEIASKESLSLGMSSKLKEVLCSDLMLSDTDVESIISKVSGN